MMTLKSAPKTSESFERLANALDEVKEPEPTVKIELTRDEWAKILDGFAAAGASNTSLKIRAKTYVSAAPLPLYQKWREETDAALDILIRAHADAVAKGVSA
jgi:hypothetical protein